jgi:hypothetical protein
MLRTFPEARKEFSTRRHASQIRDDVVLRPLGRAILENATCRQKAITEFDSMRKKRE